MKKKKVKTVKTQEVKTTSRRKAIVKKEEVEANPKKKKKVSPLKGKPIPVNTLNSYAAKLTIEQVKKIWARLRDGEGCLEISKDYPHVHYASISRINRGECWNHITGIPKHKPQTRKQYWS